MNEIREAVEAFKKIAFLSPMADEDRKAATTVVQFAERLAWLTLEGEGVVKVTNLGTIIDGENECIGGVYNVGTVLENLDAACRAVAAETGRDYP